MGWASCGLVVGPVVGRCIQNCPGGFLCPTPPLDSILLPKLVSSVYKCLQNVIERRGGATER